MSLDTSKTIEEISDSPEERLLKDGASLLFTQGHWRLIQRWRALADLKMPFTVEEVSYLWDSSYTPLEVEEDLCVLLKRNLIECEERTRYRLSAVMKRVAKMELDDLDNWHCWITTRE